VIRLFGFVKVGLWVKGLGIMRTHRYGTGVALVVAAAAALAAAVGAQSGAADRKPGNWTGKTPWGEPDLQGIWAVGYVFTPLERPKELAGKEFLTDAEVAALEREHAARLSGDGAGGRARAERGTEADLAGAYNQAFSKGGKHEKVIRTKRTSLIIDPPDGRIPPLTPEGLKRQAAFRRNLENENGDAGLSDNPESRPRSDRCFGVSLPFITGVSSGVRRIVQTPGQVALFHEDGHAGGVYRAIPITNRPPLPANIRQYLGDARGRWEGNTLVVDITNLTDDSNFQGSGANLHLVERYSREGPDLLMLRATIEDPTVFTRPWTIEIPLTKADEKANQIYESSCYEGNYAMTSILAGARALEKEQARTRAARPAAPKKP
jgi:hypothetical protein